MKIDHHLQLAMITRLVKSDTALKYSELKDDSIENSLFSYHLNKLIDRNMIVKGDEGYQVTREGARWLNDNGLFIKQREALRVYVALVIRSDVGEYLVAQRKGQFKATINDYMLPSKRYTNELDLPEQIQQVIEMTIPGSTLIEQKDYGFVQIKAMYRDDHTVRALFHVTLCQTRAFESIRPADLTEYEWLSSEAIAAIDHPSVEVLRGIISHVNNSENSHFVPVIPG